MMTIEEIREYLLDELEDEYKKMKSGQENRYSYIFMLCNDIGITKDQ